MSKNITIKEDGTSRSFTAEKLRTNLQGGGTCDWVPIDEIDQYVELEELAVTENGFYYPQSKVGFSRVSVDVQGQGGGGVVPSGTTVRGVAAENLTAGDCVYIMSPEGIGQASIVDTTLSSYSSSSNYGRDYDFGTAFDGTYVYFYDITSGAIKRISKTNLTGAPEIYKLVNGVDMLNGQIMVYTDLSSQVVIENVKTHAVVNASSSPSDWSLTAQYGYIGGACRRLTDLTTWGYTYDSRYAYKQRAVSDNTMYSHTTNGSTFISANVYDRYVANTRTRISVSTSYSGIQYNIIDHYLVAYSADTYKLGYFDLNADDGVFHILKDANGNDLIASEKPTERIKFNAEHTMLFASLVANGLAVIHADMSVSVYTNITLARTSSNMFGDYFMCVYREGTSTPATYKQILYFIPQSRVIGKTNEKNHAGSLGFVQVDIPQGTEGNAIEMFR